MSEQIKANWFPPVDAKDQRVVVGYSILNSGEIVDIKVLEHTGGEDTVQAAINALLDSSPLKQIPPSPCSDRIKT